MQNDSDVAKALRCVRDDNMIGDITGRLTVADPDHCRTGENMDLDLYFTSMASVIQSVTLKVCYTDASGNKREIELSNDGVQLHGTEIRQTITRLLPASIPVYGFMTVRAIVRNASLSRAVNLSATGTARRFRLKFRTAETIPSTHRMQTAAEFLPIRLKIR